MMKNLLKEKDVASEAVRLADLHVGCTVGFGFMPQKNISGRRMRVAEVNSYLFDNDNFVAFHLESENTEVNLIIADDGNTEGTYLALSRRLKERFFASLFAQNKPESWFDMQEEQEIEVTSGVLGAPQGWLANRYRLAMKTRGRILEGDFRMRRPSGRISLSRAFDYVLLVDDNNTHALEAEKYEDGTLIVYVTIYRPVTDIGELTLPPRQIRNVPLTSEREMFADTTANNTKIQEQTKSPAVIEIPQLQLKTDMIFPKLEPRPDLTPQPPQIERIITEFTSRPVNTTPAVHGKFGRIQPAAQESEAPKDMLACEAKLAGRIIAEAQRNQMLLSELIRKVIDLPARVNEEVHIPFKLELTEYAELARRYNLPPSDHDAVREKIVDELKLFVGINKKGSL